MRTTWLTQIKLCSASVITNVYRTKQQTHAALQTVALVLYHQLLKLRLVQRYISTVVYEKQLVLRVR